MNKMKLVLILGTRPEVIRASIIVQYLRKEEWLEFQVWDTGQHYDYELSKIFEEELDIHPDLNFHVGSGSSMEQLTKIMIETEKALIIYKPDLVMVCGDTNSTLGAALATKKLFIPIAHIEAGGRQQCYDGVNFYRDFSMNSFQEEVNRIIVDDCSEILFASTKDSVKNLKKEHNLGRIVFVGDVGYEILIKSLQQITKSASPLKYEYNLVTLHRRENVDDVIHLEKIIDALIQSKTHIIFPMHPRTRKVLEKNNLMVENNLIDICKPVGYNEMVQLMLGARYILTDSGGVQKEAFLLKVPCLTLINSCGWVETVNCGANKLIGYKDIVTELNKTPSFPIHVENIFGDGNTASKIIKYIKRWWMKK